MKKVAFCMFLIVSCSCFAQQNIFNHVWWEAQGTSDGQQFGIAGLDTIGKLNDTVLHAISIGETGSARLAFNRDNVKADTAPQAHFPGSKVVTGDINGDGIKDYVVQYGRTITVLFGKDTIGKFDTAMVLHGDSYHEEFENTNIVVSKFDSSDYDGIVISDANYSVQGGTVTLGRLLYYHGGTKLDSASAEVVTGDTGGRFVGGLLASGHIHDTNKKYLVEARLHGSYANIFLYPFRHDFSLSPAETLTILWNIDSTGSFSGIGIQSGFLITSADEDSIDDMFLGFNGTILVWRGGKAISSQYSYQFPKPFSTGSSTYGKSLFDLGDIIGRGYHTLAVSDPDGDAAGGYFGGVVFLFNLGKALSPKLAAYGSSSGFETYFGTTIIASGNENGKGQHSYMVGQDQSTALGPSHIGELIAFWGDTSFGPMVGVREDGSIPVVFSLSQNYPNPFSDETHIDFSVLDSRLYGSSVTLALYNEFGEHVETLYRGMADDIIRSLHFNAADLPSGNYFYRLECGGRETTRIMTRIN